MKLTKLVTLCLLLTATGAVAEEKQIVRELKNCGSEAENSYGSHKEYPAIDEGNGYVGFKTSDSDAKGTKLRFSLVNCETRKVVRVEAEYKLTDSGLGLSSSGDLFAYVDQLRKKNRLANESLFARKAAAEGYTVSKGDLPKSYSKQARRSDCGCYLYYPELFGNVSY